MTFKRFFPIALLFVSPLVPAANQPGPSIPPHGTYEVDSDHSFAYFGAKHHIVGLVRGRFDKLHGTITAAADPAACAVDIRIDTVSISTQNTKRDDDLRGADFFDAEKYPSMTYQGRGLRRGLGNTWILNGSLTIRGVSKVVPLTFVFNGLFPDTPVGKPARAAFHGSAAVRRDDFGMSRDSLMELGPSPTGPDVMIEIDVEADASQTRDR